MLTPENPHRHRELSTKQVELLFQEKRPTLEARLNSLEHSYHNRQHAEEVAQNTQEFLKNLADPNILTEKQKTLLVEAALRHDDGHFGNTYRQDIIGGDMSNEEYAVSLLRKDFEGQLDEESLAFMEENILATSFGQNNLDKLPENKKGYYRTYSPETDSQKLLAFADVSGFTKGWNAWADESMRLLEESPSNTPKDIDAWITNREGFVNYYISELLSDLNGTLTPEYIAELNKKLDAIKQTLSELKNPENAQRAIYTERLQKITE
jgi:hypothetical protein